MICNRTCHSSNETILPASSNILYASFRTNNMCDADSYEKKDASSCLLYFYLLRQHKISEEKILYQKYLFFLHDVAIFKYH